MVTITWIAFYDDHSYFYADEWIKWREANPYNQFD